MVIFDEKGHVYPYEVFEIELAEFREIFVDQMQNRDYRNEQFVKYLEFVEEIKRTLKIPFFQWIDGSFTTRKPFPGDVDVVSFINYDHFIRHGRFFNHLGMHSQELYGVDAHFGTTAPWRHRFYQTAVNDEQYWRDVFGFSRPDENLVRHPKGIIKIKIQ